MKRIDAHQHFWKYNAARDSWMNDYPVLQTNYLPQESEPFLQEHHFDGCIAVQADQSEDETNFLLELAHQSNCIKGIVGWVDIRADNIEDRLLHYSKLPLVKGFRHIVQAEPDDRFMLHQNFIRGISLLDKYNFTYDILIYPKHLPYAQQLVALFPEQRFVIDHLAKPNIREKQQSPWQEDIQKIASHPNVYCKISGMVTEADWQQFTYDDFVPYLSIITNAFGPNRIMFGSDYPVCLLAASYNKTMGIVQQYFSTWSAEQQALFFGGNASRFYRL